MWVAKLRIYHDDWILKKSVKYNISAAGMPLNSFRLNGKQYHSGMVFLQGIPENKKQFIASLKTDKRIKEFTVKGNQVIVLVEGEKDHVAHLFDNTMFHIKPVEFKDGYEYWEIGAWEKRPLQRFFDNVKQVADVKLLKLQQETPAIFIQYALPNITQKQQQAMELALTLGYYEFPRKTTVTELAKKLRVPRTTFQEHLRKAEAKLFSILMLSIGQSNDG